MAEKRPMRMCDVCGVVDDHPRHVFAYAVGDGVTDQRIAALAIENAKVVDGDDLAKAAASLAVVKQVMDNSTTMRHMDCCRSVGCPDGTCNEVTAGAESKRGPALVKHLTSRKG